MKYRKIITVLFFYLFIFSAQSQTLITFADSIRIAYQIPELAYAVVSSDYVYELETLGVQRINTIYSANQKDRFHIGSNTKAITSFISALLVQENKIKWETKFLDLFPELKSNSKKAYFYITLQDLLSFRGKIIPYTYTNDKPSKEEITGDNAHQRYLLAKYFLSQKPMKADKNGLTPSNADYILAGLMLEKVSGKSYKELVLDFGNSIGIHFDFDYPNVKDTLQPYGHDADLNPIKPCDNYKLNWLLSAGNINISIDEYTKFIILQLIGLKENTALLPMKTFNKLLFEIPVFSFGWFNRIDAETNHHIAYNEGNAGAFITQVEIIKEADRAYIIFANASTIKTKEGISVLLNELKNRYGK
ncbi:MAG TPA: serine hydrolase domain-containing protein [Chitinophagales bacterium]|nr:serine hydrolase domain-containing protein [Chitinophagales bacterium]